MATRAYEAGIGGKLRRKTPRRGPATPYDRPPAAVRGLRARLLAMEAGGSSGWLSKLVDPVSRLFSSVFRTRLPAPPAGPPDAEARVVDTRPVTASPSLAFSSSGNSIFVFNASRQRSSSSLSVADTTSQTPAANSDTARGSFFGTRSTISGISRPSPRVSASQFGSFSSPAFGVAASSSSGLGGSPFGSTTTSAKPFSSSSGFSFSAGAGSSSGGTSSSAAAAPFFRSSSRPSTSSVFGATFGSSAPSAGGSSFTFGSSSGSPFSFTSAGSTRSSSSFAPRPVFGIRPSVVGFSSGSTGNDQMHIEDSMADDTNRASVSMVSPFRQPNNLPAAPAFVFPAMLSGGAPVFQFGSHQNSAPFHANYNVEFAPGGSFSLGSGGGDKSGRKFVKVRRDKLRKK